MRIADQINTLQDALVAAGKNLEDYGMILTPTQETELLMDSAVKLESPRGTLRGSAIYLSTKVSDIVVVPTDCIDAFITGLHGPAIG